MRNHEVTRSQDLLSMKGTIVEEGWARHPLWNYERSSIKASKIRIKEWDYYAITSRKGGWTLCGTISDLGYAGLFSITFIDYRKEAFAQTDKIKFLTMHRTGLAPSSEVDNDVCFSCEDMRLTFVRKGTRRNVFLSAPKLVLPDGRVGLDARFELLQPNEMESMNIATSWAEKRSAFYLNQKVNCMPATGTLRRGNDTEKIDFNDDVWGVLDWGRGRWTYRNTWYRGSASGSVDGHLFGFNIGYGFTDRSPASENAIFYDGKVHKLDDIEFCIPEDDIMGNWRFTSSDGRFEMDFQPVVDRFADTKAVVIRSTQHQVFGYFTGDAKLDDGTVIHLDRFPGFAERVYNRY